MARSSKVRLSAALAAGGLLCVWQAAAFPTAVKRDEQAGIASLSTVQITAFRPYTHYASTGYCSPPSTLAWDCGHNCKANPTFEPGASGGDGDLTQFSAWCFVPICVLRSDFADVGFGCMAGSRVCRVRPHSEGGDCLASGHRHEQTVSRSFRAVWIN